MKPLSPTDAMFLWLEGRRQPMHVAGLQLYTPPAGAGDDFVRQLVEGWRDHPHARAPFDQRVHFRLGHWFWVEDTEFWSSTITCATPPCRGPAASASCCRSSRASTAP